MCLAVPGRIIHRGPDGRADVDFDGLVRSVQLDLVPEAGDGDYVIVHAGFAIRTLSRDDAEEMMSLVRRVSGSR